MQPMGFGSPQSQTCSYQWEFLFEHHQMTQTRDELRSIQEPASCFHPYPDNQGKSGGVDLSPLCLESQQCCMWLGIHWEEEAIGTRTMLHACLSARSTKQESSPCISSSVPHCPKSIPRAQPWDRSRIPTAVGAVLQPNQRQFTWAPLQSCYSEQRCYHSLGYIPHCFKRLNPH